MRQTCVQGTGCATLDSTGTSSVRLAASLRSDKYIVRYQKHQDAKYALLVENLSFQQSDKIRAALDKMELLQDEIEDAESTAIALIDEERWDEALKLVIEPSFRRLKDSYRAHLSTALREMIQQSRMQSEQASLVDKIVEVGILLTFLMLSVIALLYSREMGKLLQRESELTRSLENANAHLEQRVNDRTTALRENQQTLSKVLESIGQGIVAIDANGNLIVWNRTYQSIFGFSDEILFVGQSLKTLVLNVADGGGYGAGEPHELTEARFTGLMSGKLTRTELPLSDGRIFDTLPAVTGDGGAVIA